MVFQIISQGAEAIITKENKDIIKNRIKKSYRIPVLDEKLRKSRTRSESKIIKKLESIIPVPKIISTDEKQTIEMQFIEGKKLSDFLEKLDYKKISKKIAENIAKVHNQNIIHGDLTTSNMIYSENNDKNNSASNNLDFSKGKIYFLDFGLAFHSSKVEDKAVDLHLLKQALEAKHFSIEKECWEIILDNYEKQADKGKEIINRIKVIESRGRYKDKY